MTTIIENHLILYQLLIGICNVIRAVPSCIVITGGEEPFFMQVKTIRLVQTSQNQ